MVIMEHHQLNLYIYIYVIGAPERTEKNKHTRSLFKEMMT